MDKVIKLDIKTLGNTNDNNYLTERVLVDDTIMTIREALKNIGVIGRSIDYTIKMNGTKLKFFLQLNNLQTIEVKQVIWEKLNMLPVKIEEKKKKTYYKSKS